MPPLPIPDFQTYEEEAHFWDTHDATDYFEFKALPLTEALTVRLDGWTQAAIARQAREIGVGPSTLVRMWVREKVGAPPIVGSAPAKPNPDIVRSVRGARLSVAEEPPTARYGTPEKSGKRAQPRVLREEPGRYDTSKGKSPAPKAAAKGEHERAPRRAK